MIEMVGFKLACYLNALLLSDQSRAGAFATIWLLQPVRPEPPCGGHQAIISANGFISRLCAPYVKPLAVS
jgi:hypothetical protein